ncbi:primosomal protein N' [Actinoallomurus sp. NPDC052308]|uniref:primosomal protein N' family DNA-binding protein n=1 Tax=Actinoallomurus sp. NPDC052308 TaxID=3155530 RepID=UPI00342FFF9B
MDGLTAATPGAGAAAGPGARAGRTTPGKAPAKGVRRPAETLKVARVAVDVSLPHLDRPFDYLVPAKLDEKAVPGCRVRVRFAGQLVDGFLLDRVEESDHGGRLSFIDRVISPEPVLTPEIAALVREVADRYAGTFADVLRLAVPPRHARVEAERRPDAAVTVSLDEDEDEEKATTATDAGGAEPGADLDRALAEASIGEAGRQGDTEPAEAEAHARTAGPDAEAPGPVTDDTGSAAEAAAPSVETAEQGAEPAGRGAEPAGRGAEPAGPGAEPVRPDAEAAGPSVEVRGPGAEPAGPSVEAAGRGAEPVGPGAEGGQGAGVADGGPGPWDAYRAGRSFLAALREGRAPRAVWTALPGTDWTDAVARAARAALDGGRGVLIVVADGREVARVDTALEAALGSDRHVALTAELGPAERYRRWLAVLRGEVTAVVGTRAAMFAPVRDLGLVVLWDDGDDVHAEPHAPYPHAREVLALRAHRAGAGALIGGFTRTTDATQLVETGWAHPLVPDRDRLRRSMPHVRPAGDDAELARDEAARTARLPHLAFRVARQGLEKGPVLVQVPRRGYVPALACARCRGPARCQECEGPLALTSGHAAPYCRWCGRIAGAWRCPECGSGHVRAVVVGARRTAEELGRAFPGVPIRTSGRDGVLATVGAEPALVVATPGAEPAPAEGYAAALLLDGWVLLGRADLRAGEETLRRWTNAAGLVRPGGPVVVLADGALAPVQALLRWDPVTFAERELAERRELGFPPAVRMASLTGTPQAVRELVEAADLPPDAEVLGPVEVGDGQERALIRVDRARGAVLARCLKTAQAARSARKTTEVVRVRIDPLELI